jgi:signal transduction histidine kinase
VTSVETNATATALTLENERLRRELSACIAELSACRARMVEATDAVRRRIERNLHDGTQQRLVSVAMWLGFVDEKLQNEPDAAKPIVREARAALAVTLDELRELSQGLYPSILIERGLGTALEDLCDRSALPARLEIQLDSRPSPEIEASAYFVVSEALTNAIKHSRAHEVRVYALQRQDVLLVEVSDDGIGGAGTRGGSGLRGLTERVEAVGGRLVVSSTPGWGTSLRAEIPWRS